MVTDGFETNATATPGNGPQAVDVRDIEDALTQLWMTSHTDGRASMQAYILNLIIFAGSGANAADAQEIAARVGQMHPSRTIILHTQEGNEPRLHAWISAQCEYGGSMERSGSEQVTLEASGDGIRQLPGTLIPLLVPEVPVVLWWSGDGLFNHPIFPALMDASDQLVIDSGAFPDSMQVLARLHALGTEEYPGVALRDLAWARLTPWRELTAQFFDAPPTRPYLDNVQRVQVTYASSDAEHYNPEQALLYGSWLASRLAWEPIPNLRRFGREMMVVMRDEDAPVTLEFSARHAPDLPPGCLLSATLTAQAAESIATVTIQRADDRDHTVVTMRVREQTTQERIVPMHEGSVAEMLADEVSTVRRDHVYDEALAVAIRIASPRSGGSR
ncbi:MAG TPA: glucose-6-phosphate dehydrogenase assembly protein OpcA [Thermomicrobiales bacterium]